jgi:transposase
MDYKSLLSNIDNKDIVSISDIESIINPTGITYKELLYQLYITDKLSKNQVAQRLGLSSNRIERHLVKYNIKRVYVNQSKGKKYSKTPSDIQNETGRPFVEVVKELMDQGLSITEVTKQLELKSVSMVSQKLHLYQHEQEMKLLTDNDFVLPGLKALKTKGVEKRFREQLGIEYKDWLKQKYIDEGLSPFDIQKLTNISIPTLLKNFSLYGINKSLSQSRKDSIRTGKINYKDITSKSRKTMNKTTSSNKQELMRDTIKYYLEKQINQLKENNIEIVVGFNDWGILEFKEVDIPIIVIKGDKIRKYSVEVNGENWHEPLKESDQLKTNELINKGWNHFIFKDEPMRSNSFSATEDFAQDIVNKIFKDIELL